MCGVEKPVWHRVIVYSKNSGKELSRELFLNIDGVEEIDGWVGGERYNFVPPPFFKICVKKYVKRIKKEFNQDVTYTCEKEKKDISCAA